ncbi:MAG: hypothetical protein IPM88_16405 [Nitrospira sp.]|nr:hypothetical protein [Nitrospira sp.]
MEQRASAEAMPCEVAVQTVQRLLGPGESFVDQRYPWSEPWPPLLRVFGYPGRREHPGWYFSKGWIAGISSRSTARFGDTFLDRLKQESVYFENFSNGVQTSRGLFATFLQPPFRGKGPPR